MRLVDFDEKSPIELIQSLNDTLSSMDSAMEGDCRDEDETVRSTRISAFLTMLNCPTLPPMDDVEKRDAYLQQLATGNKQIVYAVLHWVLSNYERLAKRAYLGKFLVRIEPPSDFMQDDALIDLVDRYRELQVSPERRRREKKEREQEQQGERRRRENNS